MRALATYLEGVKEKELLQDDGWSVISEARPLLRWPSEGLYLGLAVQIRSEFVTGCLVSSAFVSF